MQIHLHCTLQLANMTRSRKTNGRVCDRKRFVDIFASKDLAATSSSISNAPQVSILRKYKYFAQIQIFGTNTNTNTFLFQRICCIGCVPQVYILHLQDKNSRCVFRKVKWFERMHHCIHAPNISFYQNPESTGASPPLPCRLKLCFLIL